VTKPILDSSRHIRQGLSPCSTSSIHGHSGSSICARISAIPVRWHFTLNCLFTILHKNTPSSMPEQRTSTSPQGVAVLSLPCGAAILPEKNTATSESISAFSGSPSIPSRHCELMVLTCFIGFEINEFVAHPMHSRLVISKLDERSSIVETSKLNFAGWPRLAT
jgi:hypothetical protein